LIPLNAHVAEHWIYMPSGGLILLLAIGGMSTGLPRRMVLGCFAALAAVLVCLTHSQSRTWVDEEAFFRTTIARGGGSPRIRANLAQVLTRKGDLPQAEAIVREALRKDPDLPMLRVQLAEILRRRGMHDEAAEIVAIDLKREDIVRQEGPIPWARDVYFVEALLSGGREKEAREALREALERHPGAWPLVRLQAMLYQKDGEAEHMFRMVADYVQKMWWHREAVIFLAQHLAAAGRFDEAYCEV
jgi:predicted Zn-dependent protease